MKAIAKSRMAAAALVVGLLVPATIWAQGEWTAPASEKAKKNPVAHDAKAVADGKKSAQVNCASCHGAAGKGDGVAAAALNPKPADWTSKGVQGQSDGEIFWKITNGRGAMPPWKHLPESERWALVHFMRSLKK